MQAICRLKCRCSGKSSTLNTELCPICSTVMLCQDNVSVKAQTEIECSKHEERKLTDYLLFDLKPAHIAILNIMAPPMKLLSGKS